MNQNDKFHSGITPELNEEQLESVSGVYLPHWTYDDDANLAGILHLVLDLLCDVVGKNRRLRIRDLLRLHHDMKLATRLHRIGALDTLMRVGNLLELFETLDIAFG